MTAEWIWYQGDYEIKQLNECLTSRYERDVFVPPFWKIDDYYKNVKFVYRFEIFQKEQIQIKANGKFNVIIDKIGEEKNKYIYDFDGSAQVDAGKYIMTVSVFNDCGLPSIYVNSPTVKSSSDFLVTCNDYNFVQAGSGGYYDSDVPPDKFQFSHQTIIPTVLKKTQNSILLDCKKELMGCVSFLGISGSGKVQINYGESQIEAEDIDASELTDQIFIHSKQYTTPNPKAFRFLNISYNNMQIDQIVIDSQYVLQKRQSCFNCSSEKLNQIYQTSLYTLSLNTRDFFLDGIKRDRWVWAGDAYQSYLMNYYSFFDVDTTKRTIRALGGKKPHATFINHIMEYSFYWIIGLYDFYMYVGDVDFIASVYPLAEEIINLAYRRENKNGMIEGTKDDWVFLDWANLDNRGQVTAEQIIYIKTLDTMEKLSRIVGKESEKYAVKRDNLQKTVHQNMWDNERQVYNYSIVDGNVNTDIKKHPHIFGAYYNLLDKERLNSVVKNVLTNDSIDKIITPYMKFYELSALCMANKYDYVFDELINYWGGMLQEGATTFWELYDRTQSGNEKYSMYGRKYGKSLCHAWGASPLYLLGRFFVGLSPLEPGYQKFLLCPVLSRLDWFEATLPLKNGDIKVKLTKTSLQVYSKNTDGIVKLDKKYYTKVERFDSCDDEFYYFTITKNKNAVINFEYIGGGNE